MLFRPEERESIVEFKQNCLHTYRIKEWYGRATRPDPRGASSGERAPILAEGNIVLASGNQAARLRGELRRMEGNTGEEISSSGCFRFCLRLLPHVRDGDAPASLASPATDRRF